MPPRRPPPRAEALLAVLFCIVAWALLLTPLRRPGPPPPAPAALAP